MYLAIRLSTVILFLIENKHLLLLFLTEFFSIKIKTFLESVFCFFIFIVHSKKKPYQYILNLD
jgi:hypothetical protein